MAGEVFRLRRDVTGEAFRLFGRGKIFPQVLHVAGFFPD